MIVALALGLGAGCGSKAPAITGLVVTVDLGGGAADQLELSVGTAAGVALHPTPRPATASGSLASPQSVSIYLPDALAGQSAVCLVRALAGGQPTGASGSGTATLVLHELVPLRVSLAPASDAGAPDAAADAPSLETAPDTAPDTASDMTSDDGAAPGALGQACATAEECDSMLCVDGVCCASACAGTCEACNLTGKAGACTPLAAGTATTECAKQPASGCGFDGTCDGNSGCRRYAPGVACKAEACQGASSYVPASACDGQGTCVAPSVVDCTPYVCDATGGAPACRADCRAGGADCVSPAVCAAASCGPRALKAAGAGCVEAADCQSDHCVDGVCCSTACTGACQSCNQTGFAGTCHPVAAAKADPRGVCHDTGAAGCGTNGTCDGAGACALYPAGATCAAGTCSNHTLRNPKRCDGNGACQAAADVDCTPYRCDPTTTACFTSCTLTLECAAGGGHSCVNHACL
jgi:hypothetical protein